MRVERGGVRAALAPGICARAGEQQVPKKKAILESVVLAGSFFDGSEGSTEAVVEMAAPPRTTGNTMWKGGASASPASLALSMVSMASVTTEKLVLVPLDPVWGGPRNLPWVRNLNVQGTAPGDAQPTSTKKSSYAW